MSIFEKQEIRTRLGKAFPRFFVNSLFEIIVYPARNTYFQLKNVDTEIELKAKIIEWLSREASKSISSQSQRYHMDGINDFLGTSFSQDDMVEIYTYLGNSVNHKKTLRFIESGYDMKILQGGE